MQNTIKHRYVNMPKTTDLLDHSPYLFGGLRFSTQDFYQRVETELAIMQVPDLEVCLVSIREGGPLSPRRQYLRCRRERLYYDICAMPFGLGFFVSEWFWEQPQLIGLAALGVAVGIIVLAAIVITGPHNEVYRFLYQAIWKPLDIRNYYEVYRLSTLVIIGIPALIAIGALIWFGERIDAVLIRIPLIGYLYERYFRKVTYYRVDRTSAFQGAVKGALRKVINEIGESQGITPENELAKGHINKELRAITDSTRRARRGEVVA